MEKEINQYTTEYKDMNQLYMKTTKNLYQKYLYNSIFVKKIQISEIFKKKIQHYQTTIGIL